MVLSKSTVGVFNDGTELRISTIRDEDIGEYTCNARNGEGHVSHTARVIIAGGAVIMVNNSISHSSLLTLSPQAQSQIKMRLLCVCAYITTMKILLYSIYI